MFPLCPRPLQGDSRLGRSLEFLSAKHVKDRFAAAGCRVEVFLQALEANTALLKGRDDLNEVTHGIVCS